MKEARADCAPVRKNGFSASGLLGAAFVAIALAAIIYPKLEALVIDSKFDGLRQEVYDIVAAIEVLKLDGAFDPDDSLISEKIAGVTGAECGGWICDLHSDGCFTYNKDLNGVVYVMRYDSPSGSVFEVFPAHAH